MGPLINIRGSQVHDGLPANIGDRVRTRLGDRGARQRRRNGNGDGEFGSAFGAIRGAHFALLLGDDRSHDMQPQASRGARGNVRFKDRGNEQGIDPGAFVGHGDFDATHLTPRADRDGSAERHRVNCIREQVDQHAFPCPRSR